MRLQRQQGLILFTQQILSKKHVRARPFLGAGIRSQAETVFALVEFRGVAKSSQGVRL